MTHFPPQGTFGTGATNHHRTVRRGSQRRHRPGRLHHPGAEQLRREHTVILVNSATQDGLTVQNRTHTIPAGAARARAGPVLLRRRVPRVGVLVGEGTQTEVKYYVLGTRHGAARAAYEAVNTIYYNGPAPTTWGIRPRRGRRRAEAWSMTAT